MLTRRELLAAGAASALSIRAADAPRQRLGIVIHSYGIRNAAEREKPVADRLNDPLRFVEHCRLLGAGGAQLPIGRREPEYLARLRHAVEAAKLYLEGSISLPKDKGDVDRFAAEVQSAQAAGAAVLRCAIGGRRYEQFTADADFRDFARQSWDSLVLAEPVVAKHGVRLAIENHKDWLIFELLDMVKRLSSRHVGITVDTGNSIALLEDPLEVVEAYAPWAMSCHLKDMGVQEYDEGFLLSEVPLGTGFLDLKKIVHILKTARPELQFSLEMITRDPLRVPCLSKPYWATFEKLPGRQLAQALALVRKQAAKQPLPRVSPLSPAEQLKSEEANVRASLKYAGEQLGL